MAEAPLGVGGAPAFAEEASVSGDKTHSANFKLTLINVSDVDRPRYQESFC